MLRHRDRGKAMIMQPPRRILQMAAESLIALGALAAVTWVSHRLHAHAVPAAILYICLVVLISLRGNLIPALLVGTVGTVVWDALFTGPKVTGAERGWRGAMMLIAFSATAIVISRLLNALRTSENRWRNVFENNPTMYFMVDRGGMVRSVNPFGAEQLGYTVDELVGRSVLDVFLEEDKQAARDHVARCLEHVGQSLSWELRKIRKDGRMLWVRETARAVQRRGEPPIVLVACEDITERRLAQDERKRAEEQLRRSEAFLTEAQRLSHTGSFGWNVSSGTIYWSEETYRIFGVEPGIPPTAELILQRTHPDDRIDVQRTTERAQRDLHDFEHEYRLLLPNGLVKHLHVVARARTNDSGQVDFVGAIMDVTERERAAAALRRSEGYLAEAQRLTHTGSWAQDMVTDNFVYWSEEMYRICGLDPQTGFPTTGQMARRLVHPDDLPELSRVTETAFREKIDFTTEYRMLLPGGKLTHLQVIGHPVLDTTGALVEFVGTAVDVTERRAAEEERQAHVWFLESMDRVNRAIQGTNDIAQMMRDALGIVRSVFNCDRACLIYPCDSDAPSWRVAMEDSAPGFRSAFGVSLGQDQRLDEDARNAFRTMREADGPVQFQPEVGDSLPEPTARLFGVRSGLATALYPKVDAPYLFALHQSTYTRVWSPQEVRLFQEISRRLTDALTTLVVLRDLRESARRYQNIFQTAAVSIWEEDFSRVKSEIDELKAQGIRDFRHYFAEHPEFVERAVGLVRIVDVNEATLSLFSASSKQGLLESLHKIFTPETIPIFVEELLTVAEGRTSFAAETVVQTVNGKRLDVLFTMAFPPESKNLDSVLVSIMDVTARKRAEEALQQARADLTRVGALTTMGELAASIAHELRQPLAAIVMNGSAALRWLNREQPNLEEAREASERSVKEAQRADEIIHGLRALLGNQAPRREAFDIVDQIREVLELVRAELRRDHVGIRTEFPRALPRVYGDGVQLQQVLLNLILNAVEAMKTVTDRGRELTLRVESESADAISVVIEDTGAGLDPKSVDRIFEPFFTTKANGLGMGLSICRSIVEAHGGRLAASSRSPYGAAFRFTVPTYAAAVGMEAASAGRDSIRNFSPITTDSLMPNA
jgi:PAS domain S-box-containing protein